MCPECMCQYAGPLIPFPPMSNSKSFSFQNVPHLHYSEIFHCCRAKSGGPLPDGIITHPTMNTSAPGIHPETVLDSKVLWRRTREKRKLVCTSGHNIYIVPYVLINSMYNNPVMWVSTLIPIPMLQMEAKSERMVLRATSELVT